jgi:hypothetical protein
VPTVLPDLDVEKVRRFCRNRVPAAVADKVRIEATIRGKNVSVHERRPPWDGSPGEWTSMPIAQLRYEGDGLWTLYFADRNGKWVRFPELEPLQPVDVLVNELEVDSTCLFWG